MVGVGLFVQVEVQVLVRVGVGVQVRVLVTRRVGVQVGVTGLQEAVVGKVKCSCINQPAPL